MPEAEAFLDSNILIYALPRQPEDPGKQAVARDLIAEQDFGISYQVFMEVLVTATRKMADPLPIAEALRYLEPFLAFPFVDGSVGLFREASRLTLRFRIHPYDAAIVAAASELGATMLYSEDLSDGQEYDGVRVINPFRKPGNL